MTKPTHINFWFLILLLLFLYNPTFSVFYVMFPFLSLLSDGDHPKSFLTKKLWFGIPWSHRWWTHTIWFSFIIAWIVFWINSLWNHLWYWNYHFNNWDYIVLFFGVFSHIVGDFFTVSGIKLLYPILKTNFKFPFIQATTNTKSEYFVSFIVLFINIVLWYIIYTKWYFSILFNWFKEYVANYHQQALVLLWILLIFNIFLFSKEINMLSRNLKTSIKTLFKMIFHIFIAIVISVVVLFIIKNYESAYFSYSLFIILISLFIYIIYSIWHKSEKLVNSIIYFILWLIYVILGGWLIINYFI